MVGPVQLIAIGFPPEARFTGEIVRALGNVRSRGLIRLLDALFVRKSAEGQITEEMHESDLSSEERALLGGIVSGLLGLKSGADQPASDLAASSETAVDQAFGFGIADLQSIKDSIPDGSSALLLLMEHQWALGLKGAVRNAGGRLLLQGLLTPEALVMSGAAVRAVIEAEDTVALAEAIEGASVLAAVATLEEAQLIQDRAVAETARVLIAAGLIEDAAAQDVVDTLVAANLITRDALDVARVAREDAKAEIEATRSAQALTNGVAPGPASAA
jgi:uncharacterized membrane protein